MTSVVPPAGFSKPSRSATVTGLAWLVILASAALIPISFITLLMVIAGSYGTASATLLGFLNVVVVPPVTLIAGIGLLRRKTWARYYLSALCVVVLAYNVLAFVRATSEPSHEVSPSGVTTIVLPTDRSMFVPIIVVSLVALSMLLSRRTRAEFAAASTPAVVPDVTSERLVASDTAVATRATSPSSRAPSTLAAVLAAGILLALAAGTGWLAYDGLATGTTVFPSKSASQRRPVLRASEPALFWVSVGLYATIAAGALGLVGWGVVQARRPAQVADWER